MMKNRHIFTLLLASFSVILLCASAPCAFANNLEMTNGTVASNDEGAAEATVQFNISWDNSWRDSINHDAVWIFLKYSTDSGATWKHATLATSGTDPSGFSSGSGTDLEIVVPADRKGCFIRRSWTGDGSVETDDIQMVWSYGMDGLSVDNMNGLDIKIIGVEMVYVSSGSFYAGDNETGTAAFDQGKSPSETDPWYIQGEDAIYVTDITANGFYYNSAGNTGENATGDEFIISDSFPKGYDAFYAMKYEITEDQWVDFFNMLTEAQKAARDITGSPGKGSDGVVNRNTVSWTSGDAATERPDRVCGYLSWMDICAYADWAGLRPMTELEFEKAARGKDVLPNNGEYAWVNTGITAAAAISGTEDGTETISTSGANACYGNNTFFGGDGGTGPLRAGIFATASSGRVHAGAAYYGNMEMSGNVWERCATVGNATGRSFQGTHGDGALDAATGNATNSDWPGYADGQGVNGAAF